MYTYKLSLGDKIMSALVVLSFMFVFAFVGTIAYDFGYPTPIVFTGILIDKNITCEVVGSRSGNSFNSHYTVSVLNEGIVTTYHISDDVYYFSPVGENISFQCMESAVTKVLTCEDSILVK